MMVAIMINTNKQRNDREGIFECATLTLSLSLFPSLEIARPSLCRYSYQYERVRLWILAVALL